MTKKLLLCAWLLIPALSCWCATSTASAASVGEKIETATTDAKASLSEAAKTAESKLNHLWQRLDDSRLKHRSRDEIVGWLIMGLLVGGILGRVTGLSTFAALSFGLIGALVAGMAVRFAQFDMGLGPVLIRYEDLLFSFVGGVLVVAGARWFTRKKEPKAKT
jgi:uncharacterized membrane protein YeaQ/YmgE (transglycosylase-associated protein family)